MSEPKKPEFQLGGQALVEGVMMRSPRFVSAAVRRESGEIVTKIEPFVPLIKRVKVLGLPMVRGVVGLFEMLSLGMRYLNWSGNIALEDENEDKPDKREGDQLPLWMFLLTVAGSICLGMALFVALPNLITDWTLRLATDNLIALNLFEGVVKLLIFLLYVWGIGLRPDIKRIFEYHGAEHKVVYAAENDQPLTPDGARPYDTPHPRCGTGFALLTVFVSVICFVFLPWPEEHWLRVGWRLLLMPVVAGISYEIIKLTTHPKLGGIARWLMIPGMWLQRLTTRHPDDSQLEVSCTAMRILLDAEKGAEPVAKPGLV